MTSYQLWERVFPEEKRWLGLICGLSLALHVAAFFVFRIGQLPENLVRKNPPSVVFVSEASVANRLDGSDPLMWIDWRNPAAIALPGSSIPEPPQMKESGRPSRRMPDLPDLPEWKPLDVKTSGVEEELKELVSRNMRLQETPAMPLSVEAPPKLSGTVVVLQGGLKGREVVRRIEMPRPQTKVSLKSTAYYVLVYPGGTVGQVKVDQSCGDTTIDQQGVRTLKKWRFAPLPAGGLEVWGKVVVFWDLQEDNPDRMEIQF